MIKSNDIELPIKSKNEEIKNKNEFPKFHRIVILRHYIINLSSCKLNETLNQT